jgi:hypothetical protein
MTVAILKRIRVRLVAVLLIVNIASPAHASGLLLVGSDISGVLQVLINPNICIAYTYDLNGNRIAQINTGFGSGGATWGSATYGCFSWTL